MVIFLLLILIFAQDFDQARDHLRRGEFAAALDACEAGLKAQPRNHQLHTLKAIALDGLGRQPESLASFRRALAIEPKFVPALQGAAQLEYKLRDPNCRKTLETLLQIRPEPTAHAMLGVLAFESKDCAMAMKQYAAAGDAANDPIIRWQRATCHFQFKQWPEAETQFQSLLAMREDDRIRYNLGLAQVEGKKFAEAVRSLRPLAQKADPDAESISLLATALEGNKQLAEGIEALRRGIELYPTEERLYIDLANLCLENNGIPLGIEVLEAGLRNQPRSARLWTMLGVLNARADQRAKAEEAFRSAVANAPDSAFGRVGLAATLMQLGAVDEAIAQLRDQHRRTPADAQVSLTLAQALLQKDSTPAELREAQGLLRALLQRDPRNARAHSLLGKLHLRREEVLPAARALEMALRLDPADRNATYQLMTVYRKQGRMKEAAALQSRVEELLDRERAAETESARHRLVRAPEGRPAHESR